MGQICIRIVDRLVLADEAAQLLAEGPGARFEDRIGEPVEVIKGPRTGLPIPAHAEIAFEGFVHPDDLLDEGPLGEWTGYYAGGLKKEPKIRVETFFHRDQPILLGAIPAMPPNDKAA